MKKPSKPIPPLSGTAWQNNDGILSPLWLEPRGYHYRLREAFDKAPVGMAICSLDSQILFANQRLCGLTGYSESELRQLPPEQRSLPSDLARESQLLEQLLQGNVENVSLEKKLLRKNGHFLHVRKNMVGLRGQEGQLVSLIAHIEHLAPRKEAAKPAAAQIDSFASTVIGILEAERKRISLELHDEIGQSLTALKIAIKRADEHAQNAEAHEALNQARLITEQLMHKTRTLAHRLRPAELDELGLPAAFCSCLNKLVLPPETRVFFEEQLADARFSPEIELCCLRVAQEAITNALRHAQATQIKVELVFEHDELRLSVRDNGTGFTPPTSSDKHPTAGAPSPLGLIGMRERSLSCGGQMLINSRPGEGTEILLSFPQPQKRA
ncbi:sensor histidine kinase [Rhodocyclus gracilis]|nr:sensor histidine kinase [Rhodocyclus gracilis]